MTVWAKEVSWSRDCSCNTFVIRQTAAERHEDLHHSITLSVFLEAGDVSVKVSELERTMDRKQDITHSARGYYATEGDFSGDAVGSFSVPLTIDEAMVEGMANGDFTEINFWQGDNCGPRGVLESIWQGSWDDYLRFVKSEILLLDTTTGTVHWREFEYEHKPAQDGPMMSSNKPVGYGATTGYLQWHDVPAYNDMEFAYTLKVKEWFQSALVNLGKSSLGNTTIWDGKHKVSLTGYDLPYNYLEKYEPIKLYTEYPGDGKGDGFYLSMPLFTMLGDVMEKSRWSWLDRMCEGLSTYVGPQTGHAYANEYCKFTGQSEGSFAQSRLTTLEIPDKDGKLIKQEGWCFFISVAGVTESYNQIFFVDKVTGTITDVTARLRVPVPPKDVPLIPDNHFPLYGICPL